MKTVCIVSGTYGHRGKNGLIVPLRAGDTVEVSDAEAKRLVNRRVATIIGAQAEPVVDIAEPKAEGDLSSMTLSQLKELASSLGINTAKVKAKADLIAAINAQEAGELPPDDTLEDPVV